MSSKNPGIDQDSMDEYLERKKAEKNYPDRIEMKYLKLRDDPSSLQEAVTCILGSFDEKYGDDMSLLMYELYQKGMTPTVESELRTIAQEIGEEMDIELYALAESEVEHDDINSLWQA